MDIIKKAIIIIIVLILSFITLTAFYKYGINDDSNNVSSRMFDTSDPANPVEIFPLSRNTKEELLQILEKQNELEQLINKIEGVVESCVVLDKDELTKKPSVAVILKLSDNYADELISDVEKLLIDYIEDLDSEYSMSITDKDGNSLR